MLEWLRNLCHHYWYSPCANIVSTMSDAKPCLWPRVQPHTTAPSWMRTTTESWCQPRKSPCCRKILSAVSCQPVIRPVLKEIYPWSISCCAHCQRVRHWSAISRIRTSVRRRRGSKALLLALHDKEESFFINSRTQPSYVRAVPQASMFLY